MIVNEEYFNDLNLTDDDIESLDSTAGENVFKSHKKFQSGYEYILYCEKHYTDRLYIEFEFPSREALSHDINPVTVKKI